MPATKQKKITMYRAHLTMDGRPTVSAIEATETAKTYRFDAQRATYGMKTIKKYEAERLGYAETRELAIKHKVNQSRSWLVARQEQVERSAEALREWEALCKTICKS